MNKIKLGVSTCLLGEKVRYDGQHKRDSYLTDFLGRYAEWTPVCPEVECGLPVPRESMRLNGEASSPRLVTVHTGIDHTERMLSWIAGKLDILAREELCGFIFKSKSPSSGMKNVKLYNRSGVPSLTGVGLFAGAFMRRFPLIPVEEEGRLNDPMLRDNFLDRIIIFNRWKEYLKKPSVPSGPATFHSRHKFIFMAHSASGLRKLGRIVAAGKNLPPPELREKYLEEMMQTLRQPATVKKHVNVLSHIMGFFKKQLTAWEKQELSAAIENYRQGLYPRLAPLTLLRHYAVKYGADYLLEQYYLNPEAEEMQLKNHV